MSMRLDPEDGADRLLLRGPGLTRVDHSQPFDTVWVRRQRGPFLPDDMHPGDKEVAERQCQHFLEGVLAFLVHGSESAFWVNPLSSDVLAEQKNYQLQIAARVGLSIPDTLISNDPAEIRNFIREHGGTVAHKLLRTATWTFHDGEREHIYGAYTAPVTEDELPDDDVLRLCPGIFQPMLSKRFEARVACLGDHLVAIRIESQTDARAATDWRAGQIHVAMEPYELPPDVAANCRRLIAELGLVHGSLDFIIDEQGEHTFLEVNPQGQFLFLETRAGLPLLDMFSEFLITGKRAFTWRDDDHEIVRYDDYVSFWKDVWQDQLDEHVVFPRRMGAPEKP